MLLCGFDLKLSFEYAVNQLKVLRLNRLFIIVSMAVLGLTGCAGGSEDESQTKQGPSIVEEIVPEDEEPTVQNSAPIIRSIPPEALNEQGQFVYSIQAVDENAATLEYELLDAPVGMSLDVATQVVTWDVAETPTGEYSVSLRVRDEHGRTATQEFAVVIPEQATGEIIITPEEPAENLPPYFSTTPVTALIEGVEFNYALSAEDPEGERLEFSLVSAPEGLMLSDSTNTISWTPNYSQSGAHRLVVRVEDPAGNGVEQSVNLSVENSNRAPEFSAITNTAVVAGDLFQFVLNAQDLDGDVLSYFIVEGPSGSAITEDGSFVWRPASNIEGDYTVELTVTDPAGLRDNLSFVVAVSANNQPPEITSLPETAVSEGELYLYELEVEDSKDEALIYEVLSAPAEVELVSSDGGTFITWSPSYDDEGEQTISWRVTDSFGATDQQSFVLTVADVNRPPEITSAPSEEATSGEEYTYQLEAIDPDEDSLNYLLVEGPSGAVLNAQNNLVWTPSDGDYTQEITVSVTDEGGEVSLQSFYVLVAAGEVEEVGSGTAIVSWSIPDARENGDDLALYEIAGYEIVYINTDTGTYQKVDVDDSSQTEYTIEGLESGNWTFQVASYDLIGIYSDFSDPAHKLVE